MVMVGSVTDDPRVFGMKSGYLGQVSCSVAVLGWRDPPSSNHERPFSRTLRTVRPTDFPRWPRRAKLGGKKLPSRRHLSLDVHSLVSYLRSPPVLWKSTSRLTLVSVAVVTKIILNCISSVSVHNVDRLLACLDRSPGVPFITVSNHVSTVDDPCMWSPLPLKYLLLKDVRWNLVAHEYCYRKAWHSYFFLLTKSIPVIRGQGVYQEGMDFALEQLRRGGWVNVFAEGKINEDMAVMRLKWGVGRLVYESPRTPMVLPMHVIGLQDVMPPRYPYIPRPFKGVTINFGNPIDLEQLVRQLKKGGATPETARKTVTDAIQEEFFQLRKQTEQLHRFAHPEKWNKKV